MKILLQLAVLLIPHLYSLYRIADPDLQNRMIRILYQGNPQTSLLDILDVFDLNTPIHLKRAANSMGDLTINTSLINVPKI
jgi:hypothetical protein